MKKLILGMIIFGALSSHARATDWNQIAANAKIATDLHLAQLNQKTSDTRIDWAQIAEQARLATELRLQSMIEAAGGTSSGTDWARIAKEARIETDSQIGNKGSKANPQSKTDWAKIAKEVSDRLDNSNF